MKKHVYLIATAAAALLAGTVFAAAQGMQKQAPGGSAEQSPPSHGQGQEQKKEQTQPGQKQGQSQKEGQKQDQGQKQAQPQTQGQGQKHDQGQKQDQPQTQGRGQKQDAQQKSGGSVTFTIEQRTRVRTTVLQDSNAPRATNVNFSINVGTAVPTSVRIATIPQLILDVQPEWRGHMYFIVGDQIIIVDRNHRIVAVIDV